MIKMALKFLFAGGIIYWLVSKGTLDFGLVPKLWDHKYTWFLGLSMLFFQALTSSFRWKILLDIKSEKKIPFIPAVLVTWIGLFFNCVLPGAVTGDIIKLIYARDLNKKLDKTFLLTSILMDRIIGLLGLLFLLGLFSIIYYYELAAISSSVKNLIHMNFLLFIGVLAFLASLFLPENIQNIFLNLANKVPKIGEKIEKTLRQVWIIGRARGPVMFCLLISIGTQALNIIAFWLIASPFFEQAISIQKCFTFMPIGFVTIAIPISPAGLGVGHAAFAELFSYFGNNNGASLFNLYFLSWLGINLLGSIPYLLSGKRNALKESKEFETAP